MKNGFIINLSKLPPAESPFSTNHSVEEWENRVLKLLEANRWCLGFGSPDIQLSSTPDILRGVRDPEDQVIYSASTGGVVRAGAGPTANHPGNLDNAAIQEFYAKRKRPPNILSISQINSILESLRFPGGQTRVIAISICLAESGGNTNALNPRNKDLSFGLWQINMLGKLGPARMKSFGLNSYEDLYDPYINAKAMIAISGNGKRFGAWSTYPTKAAGYYEKVRRELGIR